MDKLIKSVFDIIIEILPSDWEKIVLHITLGKNSQSVVFFVKDKTSAQYYSFVDLQKAGIFSKFEFQDASRKICEISRKCQGAWTGYTLVILRDGKSFIDLEFEQNIGVLPIGWDKKYLV